LDWQLSCMAQICDQFSPFLLRVNDLGINATQSPSGQDEVGGEQWLEIVRSFRDARDFRVAEELMNNVVGALGQDDGENTTLLPALRQLSVEHPMKMNEPSWDALLLFINARSASGRPVQVTNVCQCHICNSPIRQKTELERHLMHKHSFRIVCSYCKYSLSTPGEDHIFWNHLAVEHYQVMSTDALFSAPLLAYPSALELESLRLRHSSVVKPDIVASSTTGAESHS